MAGNGTSYVILVFSATVFGSTGRRGREAVVLGGIALIELLGLPRTIGKGRPWST